MVTRYFIRAPLGEWETKESRQARVLSFIEQRHFLALARQHGEVELAKRITEVNHFFIRLTNMVRATDPTSRILLQHYAAHYQPGSEASLADLLLNIVFARNTMSGEVKFWPREGGGGAGRAAVSPPNVCMQF